ncbi:MAG: NAD(+) synthase [Coprothermobacter proteolyticus]
MEETQRIEQFLREALVSERKHGYVIGVSGGLDSAVVLKLLVRAVGKENVLGLILPDRDTEKKSTTLARSLLEQEKVPYKVISMTPLLRHLGVYKDMPLFLLPTRGLKESIVRRFCNDYTKKLNKPVFFAQWEEPPTQLPYFYEGIAYYRIKHRVRMATLYYYAEKNDYLLVGCTNLSERLIGFYVKYGDDVCDVAPIAHLYKTEVRQLSEYLSVPEDIRNRPPSPDLIPGITDEYSLGVNYETLDQILAGLEEGKTAEDLKQLFPADIVELVINQVKFTQKLEGKPYMLKRA